MSDRTRISVVDNDMHNTLKLALECEGFLVTAYPRADEATLAALVASLPDLVIADGTNPPFHGDGLITRLRKHNLVVPILIYSAWADELFWRLLQQGIWVNGFLNKAGSNKELAAQVRRILIARRLQSWKIGASPITVLEHDRLRLDVERWTCEWKGRPVRLTAAEFAMLATLIERPGVPLKKDALMRAAYEDEHCTSHAVDAHMRHIRHRLKAIDPGCDIIETLYGLGYRMKG